MYRRTGEELVHVAVSSGTINNNKWKYIRYPKSLRSKIILVLRILWALSGKFMYYIGLETIPVLIGLQQRPVAIGMFSVSELVNYHNRII